MQLTNKTQITNFNPYPNEYLKQLWNLSFKNCDLFEFYYLNFEILRVSIKK